MNILKYIDFFGIDFHFYVNNQPNYQNVFGGFLSSIYFLICICIFLIYNVDDLKREKPISTTSEFPFVDPKLVNLNKEKIWIPFRIVTDENKYIDHRNILQIDPILVEGESELENGMRLNTIHLSYKLCNETSMVNRSDYHSIDIPLNEIFCLDQDNITFGGDWNLNFTNYLEIGLYLCDGVAFNESDPRCSGLLKLMETINSSLFFDLYYPVVQFQPTNLKNPISIIYKNYFYKLSAYSYKLEKLYIQEHILSDDINLLTSNSKNQSFWGSNSFFGDSYSLPQRADPIIKNGENKTYILEIYMDSGIIFYSRTYKKVIAMISDIFPFLNLIYYLFKYFAYYIKISLIKRNLSEYVFEKDKIIPRTSFVKNFENLKNKFDNNNNKNNNNKNNNLKIEENTMGKFRRKSFNIPNKNNENRISISNNQSNLELDEGNIIKILNNKKKISTLVKSNIKETKYKQFQINSPEENKLNKKKNANKHLFPYFYFLMDFIFDKLLHPKQFFCISKLYFTVYNFMCHIYDISTYILLFKQFNLKNDLLLELLSKENRKYPSRHFSKINLNDVELIEKIDNDLAENKSIIY